MLFKIEVVEVETQPDECVRGLMRHAEIREKVNLTLRCLLAFDIVCHFRTEDPPPPFFFGGALGLLSIQGFQELNWSWPHKSCALFYRSSLIFL